MVYKMYKVVYKNVYIETKNIVCKYCDKKLFNRQSRWRHEKNNFYLLKNMC